MATIVNTTPAPSAESNSGLGFLLGLIALLLLAALAFSYGVPAMRNASRPSVPSVVVPDKIDVNVNAPSSTGQ